MCAEFSGGPPNQVQNILEAAKIILNIIRVEESKGRVFPRGNAPILKIEPTGELSYSDAEFSLIPSWWNPMKAVKKTKTNRPMFATHNARIETISTKPTFSNPFRDKHCIVPIERFFESSLFGNQFAGNRLSFTSGSILFAAGCFDEWVDIVTGEIVTSFTIITSSPNLQVFEAGHDRMPVFLDLNGAIKWLRWKSAETQSMIKFLEEQNLKRSLRFDIKIDRELKTGWQRNGPTTQEIEELKRKITI